MVFKHYAFDQYPYGANILVKSTKSSISTKIDLERIDFITSSNEPVSMTYSYEEINGTLISISTNLKCTLNKNKHTFTLSNSNIFEDSTEKPYIRLLCNDVKVPISFFTVGNIANKWRNLELDEIDNQIKLWDGYPESPGKLCIPKEITIGWDTSYTTQLFTSENSLSRGTGEFCRVDIDYGYLNNNNKFIAKRDIIFISNIHTTITNSEKTEIIIPPLNGTETTITGINHQGSGQTDTNEKISIKRKFYKYFRLGFLIRLDNGYGQWQGNSAFYIKNTNKIYYSNRINTNTKKGKHYLKSDGFPILNTSFSNVWNTDFFYTFEDDENINISPSSSQIEVEYLLEQTEGDDVNRVCGDDYWEEGCGSDDGTSCGGDDDDDDTSCGGDDGTCCGGDDDDDTSCGGGDDGACCGGGDNYPYYSTINIPLRTYAAVWVYFESVGESVLVGTYVKGTYDGYWDGNSSEATIYGDFYVSGTSSNGTNCVTSVDALSVVDFTASGLTCD